MKKNLLILLSIIFVQLFPVNAVTKYYFYVQLKNKNNSPYSLSNPSNYLSPRAIERRTSFNIPIDSTDLPVNPAYVTQLKTLNLSVMCTTKWLNGVTVAISDSSLMSQVRAFSFVKSATYTGKNTVSFSSVKRKSKFASDVLDYGASATQLNQLNASYLHNQGFTGRGIHIAVLDAGFLNVNVNTGLDSLRLQGRILGTKDFTEPTPNIYGSDSHGANVLTIMAGNKTGQFIGAAPHASYWLIRTEYAPSEYVCETDFWTAGIEYADSVGADIVNSSLGYTTFDDATMNYTYAMMNGKVSRASKAATLASKKGLLVCNSAGNDGNKTWHYIGAPADADGIVSVGGVTSTGTASLFSSFGPTSDLRVKPEICAMGTGTSYINTSGSVSSGSGTSYASPLMAGMFACFLQYAKEKYSTFTVSTLIESAKKSANLYPFPTAQLGYGIPNFQNACSYLTTLIDQINADGTDPSVFVNKTDRLIIINLHSNYKHTVSVYNTSGVNIYTTNTTENQLTISTGLFQSGMYIVKVDGPNKTKSTKVAIN